MLSSTMLCKLLPRLGTTGTSAGVLSARSFAEFPHSRTRSVDQSQQPGSSPARSPDAPADPEELQWNEGAHARGSEGEKEALRQSSWKSSEVFTGNDIKEPGESGPGSRRFEAPDAPKKGVVEIASEVFSGLADKAKHAVGDVAEMATGRKNDSSDTYERAAQRVQEKEDMPDKERKA